MVTMRFPELYLSTNGAAALVDHTMGRVELVDVPSLDRRYANESVQGLDGVALSSSGTVAALRTYGSRLTLVGGLGTRSYTLPADRGSIVDMAISDAGDKIALLFRTGPQSPAGDTLLKNGRLEVWPLPPGGAPVAAVEVPVLDSGFVTANEILSTVSVLTARTLTADRAMDVYVHGERGLVPLSQEDALASDWIHAALHGEWVWIVQVDGLVGWRPGQAPVRLPGAIGDRLAFSPSGDHLLAYRVLRVVDPASAEMRFRLYKLESLQQVAQATHLVADDGEKHFALSPDLSLFALQVTVEGRLQVEELGW